MSSSSRMSTTSLWAEAGRNFLAKRRLLAVVCPAEVQRRRRTAQHPQGRQPVMSFRYLVSVSARSRLAYRSLMLFVDDDDAEAAQANTAERAPTTPASPRFMRSHSS